MIFTPKDKIIESSEIWEEIVRHKDKLISKKMGPFVGYCRAQASKYCISLERYVAAKEAFGFLKVQDSNQPLSTLKDQIKELKVPYVDGNDAEHFTVCGRKVPWGASVKTAKQITEQLFNSYGKRKQKSAEEGHDWKSLYHAVRVGYEANELLTDHELVFPRREAKLLLAIRNGEMQAEAVSDIIQRVNDDLEANLARSTLRESPDLDWIDQFVEVCHLSQINGSIWSFQ